MDRTDKILVLIAMFIWTISCIFLGVLFARDRSETTRCSELLVTIVDLYK